MQQFQLAVYPLASTDLCCILRLLPLVWKGFFAKPLKVKLGQVFRSYKRFGQMLCRGMFSSPTE